MAYSAEETKYLEGYRNKISALIGMYGSGSVPQLQDILRVVNERIANDWNQLPKYILEAQKVMLENTIAELTS